MKRNLMTYLIGAILVVIFALWLCMFQVRKSEVAVVTFLGKPTRDIIEPGAYWKLPPPFNRVYKFDQRIQSFEDKLSEEFTKDGVTLDSMVYVGWRITEPKLFYPKFKGGSVKAAESTIQSILQSAKSSVVGKHELPDFVNADPKLLKLDDIEKEIKTLVDAQLASSAYGIKVEFLGIKRLGFPESVTESIFEQMKSDRNRIASATESEGRSEAEKIRSRANSDAAKTVATANAEATRILAQGELKAAELLPVFEQNPALATFDLRLKALQDSLKQNSTLIFDPRTPPFDLFQSFSTNRVSK
ncbi:MAG: protease modulator HflC [Verrucomicrobia bacterium]|nr:MAG: protease modulator HflC [Verrucomicrobiota bacterium]